jgi:radical SAM superfamily enzyme YgiQ (UPF0313 family)
MRKGYHERSVEAIIEEIKYLHDNHAINHFQFSDELLMSTKKRTEAICEALLKLPFKVKWDCNGRLNFARPKILKLMRRSGCEYVNYGIESLSQSLLNSMGKGLTADRIHDGVRDTLKSGISPGLNLIWGFPGDTVKNLDKSVEFLKKYDPCHELRTIRPVTPYPGTKLYQKAVKMGLLDGPRDFYEQKHVNSDLFTVNFMDIDTDTAHERLYDANMKLINRYHWENAHKMKSCAERLYAGDASFRGFREV